MNNLKKNSKSIYEYIKTLEERVDKKWKLPNHNRKEYFVSKLPFKYNKKRNHNFVHSLAGLITRACRRYEKVFGMRIKLSQKVHGVNTKNHRMTLTINIYYKEAQ